MPSTSRRSPLTEACLAKYESADKFLLLFNPSHQAEYCRDLRRVYMGEAPTLAAIGKAFGENIGKVWLVAQLVNLSEFSGCKDKLTKEQLREIAEVIMLKWYYLKATELMHFFLEFKSGKYGKFYGAVDAMTILEALRKYDAERCAKIDRYEEEARKAKEDEEAAANAEEAKRFHAILRKYDMTVSDYLSMNPPERLTDEEIEAMCYKYRHEAPTPEEAERRRHEKAIVAQHLRLMKAIERDKKRGRG